MYLLDDIVNVSKGFIPSIKIEYHMANTEMLKNYVPTEKAIDIIRNFCINKYGSNVVIGSYGSGKSYLMSLIANIMSGGYSLKDYEEFIKKVENIDDETSVLLSKRIKDKKKRLVIIPTYYSEGFEQAMLIGISKALEREGLDNFVVKSSFKKAKDEIKKWNEKFPKAYEEFFRIVEEEYFIKKDIFISGIENFNKRYYEIFVEIYPKVTSGAKFFYYDNNNIIGIIMEINKEITKYEYDGIDIIFDEFGSFLDKNINTINMLLVQELAQLANNSDNKISFYLVTHKDLSQYGTRISDDIVTEWRKVEGRFKRFLLYQNPLDIYQIISNVLPKDEIEFKKFYFKNEENFLNMYNEIINLPTFEDFEKEEIQKHIIRGCFPLSPLAVLSLHKISDIVAQNNRTLITFLLSDEENTVGNFIKNPQGCFWICGDTIYDYFEQALWNEDRSSYIYSIWKQVHEAINKVENNELYKRIIKTIGLIYIINDFDKLKPNEKYISILLPKYTNEEIISGLDELMNRKIIFYRRIYDIYKFYEGSDINIEDYMEELIETNKEHIDIIEILNHNFLPSPLLPRRYNDKYCINRYFINKYVRPSDVHIERIKQDFKESNVDGKIYYVVPDSQEDIVKMLENRYEIKDIENLIILLPRNKLDLEKPVSEYWAILELLDDEEFLTKESFLKEELLLYEESIRDEINYILSRIFNNDFNNIHVINAGDILLEINNRYTLQKETSRIMENVFHKTPILNNEMINKNNLTSTMKSVLRKVINNLWQNKQEQKKFKFKKFSAEHTTIKTIYINTNILLIEQSKIEIKYEKLPNNSPIKLIFNEIEKFLEDCRRNEKNFYDLYKVLKDKPYGLKDGVIPLLFAVAIIKNIDNIYIKKKEVYKDLDGRLIVQMVNKPQDYLISIDIWDEEKENYILELEKLFNDYIDYEHRKKNRLAALYEGIKTYYKRLPKFTRETSYISENAQRVRQIMSNDYVDYKKLFFDIFLQNNSFKVASGNICSAKKELDSFLDKFKIKYSKKIASNFDDNQNDLEKSISYWFKNIDTQVKEHIFDLKTNLFIKYINEFDKNCFLEGLIKTLTGFDIEYFTDELAKKMIMEVEDIKQQLETYNVNNELGNNRISLEINDIKISRNFKNVNLSYVGATLMNKIQRDIENIGGAINREEILQILMELLQSYV